MGENHQARQRRRLGEHAQLPAQFGLHQVVGVQPHHCGIGTPVDDLHRGVEMGAEIQRLVIMLTPQPVLAQFGMDRQHHQGEWVGRGEGAAAQIAQVAQRRVVPHNQNPAHRLGVFEQRSVAGFPARQEGQVRRGQHDVVFPAVCTLDESLEVTRAVDDDAALQVLFQTVGQRAVGLDDLLGRHVGKHAQHQWLVGSVCGLQHKQPAQCEQQHAGVRRQKTCKETGPARPEKRDAHWEALSTVTSAALWISACSCRAPACFWAGGRGCCRRSRAPRTSARCGWSARTAV
jgi:hypothetical protein